MLPAYNPTEHLPPPVDLLPTLTVVYLGAEYKEQYRAYLSQALAMRLGLKPNQPIDLIPPPANSPYWHLDLRPQAKRRIAWYADTRPRIGSIRLPIALLGTTQSLALQLVPGEPAFPGFYPLLPSAQLT